MVDRGLWCHGSRSIADQSSGGGRPARGVGAAAATTVACRSWGICRHCWGRVARRLPDRGGRPEGDPVTDALPTPVLPPGLSQNDFSRALEALVSALGADAVVTSEAELEEDRDPYAFGPLDEFVPSAVVMPQSVEEIQAILRIANEHRIPLWTVSAGMNNAYGGAAPRVRGSGLVHLQRGKRGVGGEEEGGPP